MSNSEPQSWTLHFQTKDGIEGLKVGQGYRAVMVNTAKREAVLEVAVVVDLSQAKEP